MECAKIHVIEGIFGKITIYDTDTEEELWCGKSRDLAEISMPEGKTERNIGMVFGFIKGYRVKEKVEAGKEYGMFFRMRTFGAEYLMYEYEK